MARVGGSGLGVATITTPVGLYKIEAEGVNRRDHVPSSSPVVDRAP